MSQPSPPPDPYGQQPQGPYGQQPQGYSQPGYGGYGYPPAAKKPIEWAKFIFIAAWVVLGLYFVRYFYILTQDEEEVGADFADRFFGSMDSLGTGVLYAGILLAVSKWYEKQD